jgi:hypothetical protein
MYITSASNKISIFLFLVCFEYVIIIYFYDITYNDDCDLSRKWRKTYILEDNNFVSPINLNLHGAIMSQAKIYNFIFLKLLKENLVRADCSYRWYRCTRHARQTRSNMATSYSSHDVWIGFFFINFYRSCILDGRHLRATHVFIVREGRKTIDAA